MSDIDMTKWKAEGHDISRTVGAFKLLVGHDADADEWSFTVMALGSGYRDGGARKTVEIDGGWVKQRDSAINAAEDSLALLLGDTLTELGLDGRSYNDGTAMTFERVVPGEKE
ncbi:hypothetical protein WHZ77_06125 [Bradyrhizobium sp. A5]|uniref:hypothetical protein n=1 Tax=Bradyrhizobium sp. A5 TaxID=3133696 RepID=UPI0032522CD8